LGKAGDCSSRFGVRRGPNVRAFPCSCIGGQGHLCESFRRDLGGTYAVA
jgi:hypothetical protein